MAGTPKLLAHRCNFFSQNHMSILEVGPSPRVGPPPLEPNPGSTPTFGGSSDAPPTLNLQLDVKNALSQYVANDLQWMAANLSHVFERCVYEFVHSLAAGVRLTKCFQGAKPVTLGSTPQHTPSHVIWYSAERARFIHVPRQQKRLEQSRDSNPDLWIMRPTCSPGCTTLLTIPSHGSPVYSLGSILMEF